MARILFMLPLLAVFVSAGFAAETASPVAPDRDVSERPIAGPPFPLLTDMPSDREAWVLIECTVAVDGVTKDCRIVDHRGPLAFADAAREYVSHSRYSPASSNGVAVETHHRWTIRFPPVGL